MFQHLRYQGVRVETRSPAGECAEKHLMFNDEESLKYSELIIDLIAMAEEKRNELEGTIKRLEEQATIYPEQAELLGGEKQSTEIELRKIEQHLMRITGRS
jgi:hypothetical protein